MRQCEKCKYHDEEEGCLFYSMGSGNPIDMPCAVVEEPKEDDNILSNIFKHNIEICIKSNPFRNLPSIDVHMYMSSKDGQRYCRRFVIPIEDLKQYKESEYEILYLVFNENINKLIEEVPE